jgi:ribonuclease P protein component
MSAFRKDLRLSSSDEYKKVFDSKKTQRHAAFTVFYRKNELNRPRIGLAISKKSVNRSVDRNKIKRIIRESFRHSSLISCDYVVVVSPKIKYYSRQEFRNNLDKAWIKFENS